MNYTNTGFLETDIEFAKDLEKALQEHEIHFSEYDALNGKTATFYEEKRSLKGQIDFYGDENGRYAIHNSPLHSYTQDEAILMDATVSELLEELNRKNSEICFLEFRKDGRQVKRKFFASYKEAYMEMKEKYDTYFSVDYPNFAISKHSAFIHTFQNRLEWNLICSNPSETE